MAEVDVESEIGQISDVFAPFKDIIKQMLEVNKYKIHSLDHVIS